MWKIQQTSGNPDLRFTANLTRPATKLKLELEPSLNSNKIDLHLTWTKLEPSLNSNKIDLHLTWRKLEPSLNSNKIDLH